jgi:hypothetical protein
MPAATSASWEKIVPFHKLTQWLCYSLMVPMTKLMHVHFAGTELLTGLPEYRNGGLLIDTGLLTLKPADAKRGLEQYQINAMKEGQPNMEVVPMFSVDDDVIVEWRALTVGFLDELCFEVNSQLGLVGSKKLSLAQVLEAGSWKVSKIVGWRKKQEHSLTNTTGRQRTCRGHKTQHQGTTDHDCVGWHRLLIDTPTTPQVWSFCSIRLLSIITFFHSQGGTCIFSLPFFLMIPFVPKSVFSFPVMCPVLHAPYRHQSSAALCSQTAFHKPQIFASSERSPTTTKTPSTRGGRSTGAQGQRSSKAEKSVHTLRVDNDEIQRRQMFILIHT